jgi:hypothetical protein
VDSSCFSCRCYYFVFSSWRCVSSQMWYHTYFIIQPKAHTSRKYNNSTALKSCQVNKSHSSVFPRPSNSFKPALWIIIKNIIIVKNTRMNSKYK